MINQRRFERLMRKVIVWYGNDRKQMTGSLTKNISAGGLLIEVKEKVDKDSVLNLEVKLPGKKDIMKLQARVVRAEDQAGGSRLLGMEYTVIDQNHREAITNYIQDNMKSVSG